MVYLSSLFEENFADVRTVTFFKKDYSHKLFLRSRKSILYSCYGFITILEVHLPLNP